MYVKMVRRTEVPSLMGTRIFSFAGVPKNDLILLHPTTEFKSCHFFVCLYSSSIKFILHIAVTEIKLYLKIILKNFDLPLYEWRCLSTDIFVDFFALDFIFIP